VSFGAIGKCPEPRLREVSLGSVIWEVSLGSAQAEEIGKGDDEDLEAPRLRRRG